MTDAADSRADGAVLQGMDLGWSRIVPLAKETVTGAASEKLVLHTRRRSQ